MNLCSSEQRVTFQSTVKHVSKGEKVHLTNYLRSIVCHRPFLSGSRQVEFFQIYFAFICYYTVGSQHLRPWSTLFGQGWRAQCTHCILIHLFIPRNLRISDARRNLCGKDSEDPHAFVAWSLIARTFGASPDRFKICWNH